jgi:hypothetical protein
MFLNIEFPTLEVDGEFSYSLYRIWTDPELIA